MGRLKGLDKVQIPIMLEPRVKDDLDLACQMVGATRGELITRILEAPEFTYFFRNWRRENQREWVREQKRQAKLKLKD